MILFSILALGLLLPNLAFAEPGTISVKVNDSTYDVKYDATGLEVTDIEADTTSSTLTVFVTTSDATGTLKITLDRNFFDSKTNDVDDEFLVLADGSEASFKEAKNSQSRTLTITVPSDTNSVDITALGSTSFSSEVTVPQVEQPPVDEQTPPADTTEQETTPPVETPNAQICGTGTILKDGECIVEKTDTPKQETTTPVETPKEQTACGLGTILKDGACVLDETCGAGTVLKDGVCVLEEAPDQQAPVVESSGLGADLIAPIVASFVIAFVIMVILWSIGRAGRNKN